MKSLAKIIAIQLLFVLIIQQHLIAQVGETTISGVISYSGMTSTGKFWVWASTKPVTEEGSVPVALSSYTYNGNVVNINYALQIPSAILPANFYIYAVRDWNQPFVEDYLQNPQSNINPIHGDPFGAYPLNPVFISSVGATGINFTISDPPQGRIAGTIYYSGTVLPTSVLKIAVGHKLGDWIATPPVGFREIVNPSFPYNYDFLFLPDATDYYVVAVLDDNNPNTPDPSGKYGPVTISGGNEVTNVNIQLQLSAGAGNSVIEGMVFYDYRTSGAIPGPLYVLAFVGYPGPDNTPVGYRVFYSVVYPQFFRIDMLPASSNYYILAFVDANRNVRPDSATEPMGVLGPFVLTVSTTVLVTMSNPPEVPGTNRISGNINYSGTMQGTVYIKTGFGDGSIIYSVKGETSRYGVGYYEISNLPDGNNYYITAFMDLNNNREADTTEPSSGLVGPINLSGGIQKWQDIQLKDAAVAITTITVTIRGKVVNQQGAAFGGVIVSLVDTGGFNDTDPSNDRIIATTVSTAVFSTDNTGQQYNYEFVNVPVVISDQYYYGYRIVASKPGCFKRDTYISFYSYQAWKNVYNWSDLVMELKPQVTLSNFTISPTTISPDNDGINDVATVSFKYSIATTQRRWENSARVKFIVDSDDDGNFEPIDWNVFVVDNQGRRFIKKDPNYYVDPLKPLDYTKLEGPISDNEYNKMLTSYDATVEWEIAWYNLITEQDRQYQDVSFVWNGKNSIGQVVKNGTHFVLLRVEDVYGDVVAQTTTQITIQVDSIKGTVKDKNNKPVEGARVICSGLNLWTQAYTDTNGNFEIYGVKSGNYYRLEVSKEGYVQTSLSNVSVSAQPVSVTLQQGVKVNGVIFVPNPPKAGTVRDTNGNLLFDLWCNIEAQNLTGPGWIWQSVRLPLPSVDGVVMSSVTYTIYLSPNSKYRLVVKAPRYVSSEVIVEIGEEQKIVDIFLQKSVSIIGMVKLPNTIDEDLYNTIKNGFGVSVWANSKDGKYHSNTWVSFSGFEVSPGSSKTFIIDSIVPGTTYTVGIDAQYFARRQRDVWVGQEPRVLVIPFILDPGAKLTGTLKFGPGVYSKIRQEALCEFTAGEEKKLGAWIPIRLQSMRDFSWVQKNVFVSTDVIANQGNVSFTIPGLQQGVWYKLHLDNWPFESVEVTQKGKEIFISTISAITALSEPIEYILPMGVVKGRLINNTGKSIDFSKVQLQLMVIGGGESVVTPDANGNFVFNNIPTGEGILWGCEYDVKPLSKPGDYFGIGTGNVGMFGRKIYSIHGSTVDIGNIELKPAGVIKVILKSSPELIDEIYTQTTTYLANIAKGVITPEGPYGLVRVQPGWLKDLGEELERKSATAGEEDYLKKEEISIGLDPTIQKIDNETLQYTFNSAEEGVYNIYIMVGPNRIAKVSYPQENWRKENWYADKFTAYPMQHIIVAKAGVTQTVIFNISAGVEVNGSITRDISSAGKEETIKVFLKEPYSGKIIASYDVVFDSTTKNLTTKSFKFTNVPPGRFVLLVWSTNYKVYTREISLSAGVGSVSLTPIVLTKGANIVGKLVDENGNAIVSGVVVECIAIPYVEGSYRNTEMEGLGISATISQQGQFRLTNLPKGTYIVRVFNKGNQNYVPTVRSGIQVPDIPVDVEIGNIIVKKGVEVSGYVYKPDGVTPLANVPVVIYPQDIQLRSGLEIWANTDKNGRFVLYGVNHNIKYWEIKANVRSDDPSKDRPELRQYSEQIKSYINVQNEEVRRNIKIVLTLADAEVKGQVKTSDGGSLMLPCEITGIDVRDAVAAVVLLQSPKDITSGDPFSGVKVLTRTDGTFNIKGVSSGKHVLKVFSRGYATKVVEVDIKPGVNNVGTITLEKGAKVSGVIRTPYGQKVAKENVAGVVAADRKFKEVVVGFVNYNRETREVEGYEINGLKANVTYYLTMISEGGVLVITDPQPLYVPSPTADLTKNLVFAKPKPHFEVKSYKFKQINKNYISKWLEFFETNDLYLLLEMPKDTWATHLMIAQLLRNTNVDLSVLPNLFDLYLIFGFISQPVVAENVPEIVFPVNASGTVLPFGLLDTKKQFVIGYIPASGDVTRGYFELKFAAKNFYDERNEETYKFYLGEDAKAEKIITPLIGGYVTVGEGDNSGLEVPPGTEFENVDVSSNTKIVIRKYEKGTVSQVTKLSPKMFATELPSPLSYPGELVSGIYDMQIRLLSGPLATLAQNNKVKLTILLSSGSVKQEEADMYRLCRYNENTNKWDVEDTPITIDWQKLLATAEVSRLSKFAVFKVVVSTLQPYSGEFKAYVYPNPVKNVDRFNIRVCIPGSGGKVDAEIKIYNIAGELVRSLKEQVTPGFVNNITDIELKNDKGENLASGVYILYIKVDKNKKIQKFAIIR